MDMTFSTYYSDNHSYDFLVAAAELCTGSQVEDYLKLKPHESDTNDDRHRKSHDLKGKLTSIDEHNFFIIRLTVALELALKGIALEKGYNIFVLPKVNDLIKIRDVPTNLKLNKTLPLRVFIEAGNLEKSIGKSNADRYIGTFKFLKNQRDDFVHFAKRSYSVENKLLEHLENLSKFFKEIVLPLKNNVPPYGRGVSIPLALVSSD